MSKSDCLEISEMRAMSVEEVENRIISVLVRSNEKEIGELIRNSFSAFQRILMNNAGVISSQMFSALLETVIDPKCDRYEEKCLALECAFIMLAAKLHPADVEEQLFHNVSQLLTHYPNLQRPRNSCIDMSGVLRFRNWMFFVLKAIGAKGHRNRALILTFRISEAERKTTNSFGGGNGMAMENRMSIYRHEGHIEKKLIPRHSPKFAKSTKPIPKVPASKTASPASENIEFQGKKKS